MHVHSITSLEDAEQLGEKGRVLDVLHDYRDQGIIRHIGFTGHTTAEGIKRAAELYFRLFGLLEGGSFHA